MTLNEYQKGTLLTWGGPMPEERAVMGLAEEAGEAISKYQKWLRCDYGRDEMKKRIALELGDVLFYVAVTAHELGFTLEEVAEMNQAKLLDRKQRGVIQGDGDNR